MYTHLHITDDDARTLFTEYARRAWDTRPGAVTHATLEEHFDEFSMTHLRKLGANLEQDYQSGTFVLKYNHYVPHLPQELAQHGIVPVSAEIVRFWNAPTKARAGYYEDAKLGFTAIVERVFPEQRTGYNNRTPIEPLYAQNIRVSGPSLAAVQEYNTKLCTGAYNRFLVNAFE